MKPLTTYVLGGFVLKEQAQKIEVQARGQAEKKLWNIYRAGRITASNFKSAAIINQRICYPYAFKFSTGSIR